MNDLRTRLRSLRSTERHIIPDEAWVRRTRTKLLTEIAQTIPKEQMPIVSRAHEAYIALIGNRVVNVLRKPMLAMLSATTVITGGSILSVSAAEQSLPGDFFYGLKLVTEQARLALTSAKEDRLALKTEFTGRRVTELQEVASADPKRPKDVVEVAEILKRDLDTVKQQLADVKSTASPEKTIAAAKLVEAKSNEVITALQSAKAVLPVETQEKMTDVQSVAAETGVSAIAVLAEAHETSNESVPAEEVAQALQDHAKVVSDATSGINMLMAPSSSTSSTVLFSATSTTTSTNATVTTTLPQLVSQVKDLTTQAFAQQKVKDQLEAGAATGMSTDGSATGTTPGTDTASTSTSPTTSSTSSTVSVPPVTGG
ncbi:hypothetical protein KBC59_04275 [Patescibacteria group bacterium]|jgi:hypothetical protein|nr:hypothetical protein [Patescibacteria group bacterium]